MRADLDESPDPLQQQNKRSNEEKSKVTKRPKKITKSHRSACERLFFCITENNMQALKHFREEELLALHLGDYGWNALHLAINHKQKDVFEYLINLNCGKQLIQGTDLNGDTPLHIAVFAQYAEGFQMLYNRGASLDVQNKYGEKPLDITRAAPFFYYGFLKEINKHVDTYEVREMLVRSKSQRKEMSIRLAEENNAKRKSLFLYTDADLAIDPDEDKPNINLAYNLEIKPSVFHRERSPSPIRNERAFARNHPHNEI